MMTIDEQIKALKRKKAKIGLYQELMAEVEKKVEAEAERLAEFPDLLKEVATEVAAFCARVIQRIEGGEEAKVAAKPVPAPKAQDAAPSKPPKEAVTHHDKVGFAMAHRHLDRKRCETLDGTGTIRGTDAPYLVIELDGGIVTKVLPEEIRIIGE